MWLKSCLICLMFAPGAQAAPATGDFESGPQGWKPHAATVKVERVTEPGATAGSRACLRIHGRMKENWNYAVSDSVPLRARELYRLSAWVKVISSGAAGVGGVPTRFRPLEDVSHRQGGQEDTQQSELGGDTRPAPTEGGPRDLPDEQGDLGGCLVRRRAGWSLIFEDESTCNAGG